MRYGETLDIKIHNVKEKNFLAEATTWDSCISVKPNKIARTEWDNLVLYCVSKRPVAPRVNRTVDGGKDERQLNKSSNCSYERPVRL